MKTRKARQRNVKPLSRARKRHRKSLSLTKSRKNRRKFSEDQRLDAVGKKVQEAFVKYYELPDPTGENEIELQVQKQSLHSTYNQCMEEELKEQMRRLEALEMESKHGDG